LVTLLRRLKSRKLGAVVLAAGALLMLVGMFGSVAIANHVTPTFKPGNPTCGTLISGTTELKINNPSDGTFSADGFSVTIDVRSTADGQVFDFTVTAPEGGVTLGVVAKGGPNANFYDYRPSGEDADTGLHSPFNENSGQWYGLSHISFCFVRGQQTTTTTAGETTTTTAGETTTTTAGETTTTTAGQTTTTTAGQTTTTAAVAVAGVQITPTTAAPAQVAGARILPVTGPSRGWTLFLVGMAFVLGGLILVFGQRHYRPRNTRR
jgi:hypothetical protein